MSELYLWLYIFLWGFVLLKYLRRQKVFGAGGLLITSYLIFAIAAWALYTNPFSAGSFKELHLFPFLYLFMMLLIASLPIIQYDYGNIPMISRPNIGIINIFSYIYIVATFVQLPDTLSNMGEGIAKIITDPTAGAELYTEAHENVGGSVFGQITNVFAIIHNLLSDIAVIIFFYVLTLKRPPKWLVFGFSVAMIIDIMYPLSRGLRTDATMKIFTILIAYFAMKPFLDVKIKKIASRAGLVLLFLLMTPFVLITVSRFGNWDGGALYSTEYYLGQAPLKFNNYGLDAGGIRYGDRTATLFKSVFFDDVPRTIMDGRRKYPYLLLDDSNFSTFVGDFTIDYGPVWAFILFVIFSVCVCVKTRPHSGVLKFHQLILCYFSMCVCMQGGMYLFNYAYGLNLVIIAFALAYFTFKFTAPKKV